MIQRTQSEVIYNYVNNARMKVISHPLPVGGHRNEDRVELNLDMQNGESVNLLMTFQEAVQVINGLSNAMNSLIEEDRKFGDIPFRTP